MNCGKFAREYDMVNMFKTLPDPIGDQLILKAINATHPELVGLFPKEWDVTLAHGKLYNGLLINNRPDGVGMMHFNGGSGSKESAFENTNQLKDPKHYTGWGNANYYVRLTWPYAKFIMETMKEGDKYPLAIH
jgi:hypothetical protein